MNARAITARPHVAGTVYSNIPGQDIERRRHAIFAGLSPIEQKLTHARAEWNAAEEAWKQAMQSRDTAAEAHWNQVMDRLNADIEELEDRQQQERRAAA